MDQMSAPMNRSIFEDLEIEFDDMLSNPKELAKRVMAKANELVATLESDSSVSKYEEAIKNSAASFDQSMETRGFIKFLREDLYSHCDAAPLEEVALVLENMRNAVREIETLFHSRSVYEATRSTSPLANKKVALYQHQRLREAYEAFRTFAQLMLTDAKGENILLPTIKAKSGNFGSGLSPLKSYVFTFENGDMFMNHFAVARRLGIHKEGFTLMDLLEYLEATPDAPLSVSEVQF
jgi:hypothetical protein